MIVGILALLGSGVLAGVGVFTFFGGYWYQLLNGPIDTTPEDE